MVDLHIAKRQDVEIDHCPQCRGVWLDRGELDKIIERTIEVASPRRRAEGSWFSREDRGMRIGMRSVVPGKSTAVVNHGLESCLTLVST
ncbi:MAG TPA: zf-TFIIB domain-containing protein, partial [Pyrinomonadaceae bacterium]|nr:zf-TFIIB domain-containing protein [Pyrinomonadaceae bacterium]